MPFKALLAVVLLTACGSDDPYPDFGTDSSAAVTTPPKSSIPGTATLCRLKFGVSTPKDTTTLLGKPTSINDSGDFTTIYYAYDDFHVSLFLDFVDQRLDDASVENATYPQCWRDMKKQKP